MNIGVSRQRTSRKNVVLPIVSHDNKLKRKRKKSHVKKISHRTTEDCVYFTMLIISVTTFCFGCSFFVVKLFLMFTLRFNNPDPHGLHLDIGLYDEINSFFRSDSSKRLEVDEYMKKHIRSQPFKLSSVYGPSIDNCELTVILMDPRLPMQPAGSPVWFTLESIGSFASYSCVTIQTCT
uniref:Uncharacterized protein n=1 Tax=Eucampia antarctica TaxID=49252 RepID=A0A7S2W2E2_9STRA|mmetsp:Transcript_17715/g.17124  ORF Transcript_17715/g.17124 Transcript_17715/m.17124 type:complete len:179 (+) Transcript_17715:56-592(+)